MNKLKRFTLTIDGENGVKLKDVLTDNMILYIRFKSLKDAIDCRDALTPHVNLMNSMFDEILLLNNKKLKILDVIDDKIKEYKGFREYSSDNVTIQTLTTGIQALEIIKKEIMEVI